MSSRTLYPWLLTNYRSIAEDFAADKLHHALLFHGIKGLGKSQLIERIVELIHCQAPRDNKACGRCQDCQLHNAKTHSDSYYVGCAQDKHHISIDQIRTLAKKIQATGLVNPKRIVVIESVAALTESAVNALLKILEEPPKEVYFLLSTHAIAAIPATIMSRCFKVAITPAPPHKMAKWLEKKSAKAIDPRYMTLLGGSPLRAIDAIDTDLVSHLQPLIAQLNQLYHSWAKRCVDSSVSASMAVIDTVESLLADKSLASEIVELIDLIMRFNYVVLKVKYTPIAAEKTLIEPVLLSQLHQLSAIKLTQLASSLGELKRLLSANGAINIPLQLQQRLHIVTSQLGDN